MLIHQLNETINQNNLWGKNDRLLIAVSTGVDSMVLLHLLKQLPNEIAVVHVNHQLRTVANQEAEFLKKYCEKEQLPYFETTWENPTTSGIEDAARTFRYQFFAKVMREQNYTYLVTAHHQDDQMETMLMKMIRDGQFYTSAGIRLQQSFKTGSLVRPLLTATKKQLMQYARTNQIIYFEDESNQNLDFQRNRLRHNIIPQLQAENGQASEHFQQLSQQLIWAQQLIENQQAALINSLVNQQIIDYQKLTQLTQGEQYYFLRYYFQEMKIDISAKQLNQVLLKLNEDQAHWTLDLKNNQQIFKSYNKLAVRQKNDNKGSECIFTLSVNQGMYLSKNEWIGLFEKDRLSIPVEVEEWETKTSFLKPVQQLTIRKRRPGDRIALTISLTKRISRFFIDNKVPQCERMTSWVVVDGQNQVISVLPFVFSYLSIASETDKIHYVLLYKFQK